MRGKSGESLYSEHPRRPSCVGPAGRPSGEHSSLNERNLAIAAEVTALAGEIGRSPSQVALSWVRRNSIPILGARNVAQLTDNLGCLDVVLAETQVQRLEKASRIELGFPHEFLTRDLIRQIIFGGTFAQIDAPAPRG